MIIGLELLPAYKEKIMADNQSSEYDLVVTPLAVAVHRRKDNPIFGESTVKVFLDDEAAGPFIVLEGEPNEHDNGQVRLDMDQLDVITAEAHKLIKAYPDNVL